MVFNMVVVDFRNIDEVVKHADRLEDVVSMLRQVGGRHGHQGHNVPSAYFPVSLYYIQLFLHYHLNLCQVKLASLLYHVYGAFPSISTLLTYNFCVL